MHTLWNVHIHDKMCVYTHVYTCTQYRMCTHDNMHTQNVSTYTHKRMCIHMTCVHTRECYTHKKCAHTYKPCTHMHTLCTHIHDKMYVYREGNGPPLWYSCLENPRYGGAR